MRNSITLIIILLWSLALGSCGSNVTEENLWGTWCSVTGREEVRLTCREDQSCVLEIHYPSVQGDSVLKVSGNYAVDFRKRPIPFTIKNIPRISHPLHSIIRFQNRDTLWLARFAPRWRLRPLTFAPNGFWRLRRCETEKVRQHAGENRK